MGERLRREYSGHRSLSASDVEDVWSTMLARLVQAPGPNRLPAEADQWNDATLFVFLRRSFGREIGRAAKQASNGDGVRLHSPLDGLAEDAHRRGVIWADAAPQGPEQSIFARLDAVEYASRIRGDAGPEAATVMFARAMGASPAEQQQAVGIPTRPRFDTLRGRLEVAGNAAARRAHAFVLWLTPDWLLRWISALLATGSVPRIGGVGVAIAALAAGSVGVTTATRGERPTARPLKPVAARVVAEPLKEAAQPLRGIVLREQTRARAVARAQSQKQAAARRREVRSRQRAAAQRKAAAEKATADRQFSPAPITASPSSAAVGAQSPAPRTSTQDRSTADGQFGLGE